MLVDITARHRAEKELAATRDSLDQRVSALSRLHDLAIRLTGTSDLGPALHAILATLVEVHDADFGLMLLYDPAEGQLCEAANVGLDSAALSGLTRIAPGTSGGPCGTAFANRERIVIEDV